MYYTDEVWSEGWIDQPDSTVAVRETPGSRIFAGSCTVVQSVRHFTTTAYVSRRTTVCATKRAVDDDGVCEQAYDHVQRNGRSTTTAYASRRSSVCATYRAVNDDVVATGSNDGCRLIAE